MLVKVRIYSRITKYVYRKHIEKIQVHIVTIVTECEPISLFFGKTIYVCRRLYTKWIVLKLIYLKLKMQV